MLFNVGFSTIGSCNAHTYKTCDAFPASFMLLQMEKGSSSTYQTDPADATDDLSQSNTMQDILQALTVDKPSILLMACTSLNMTSREAGFRQVHWQCSIEDCIRPSKSMQVVCGAVCTLQQADCAALCPKDCLKYHRSGSLRAACCWPVEKSRHVIIRSRISANCPTLTLYQAGWWRHLVIAVEASACPGAEGEGEGEEADQARHDQPTHASCCIVRSARSEKSACNHAGGSPCKCQALQHSTAQAQLACIIGDDLFKMRQKDDRPGTRSGFI